MRRAFNLVSAALTLGVLSTSAHAAVVIPPPTSNPFDVLPPAAGEVLVNNFDGTTNPLFTFSGGTIQTGNVANISAAPAGDLTHYEAAQFHNSFVIDGPVLKSLSLYIGSLDAYNTITFNGAGGFTQSFTGLQLSAGANGSHTSPTANQQFFFTFGASDKVDQIIFSSGKPAFEFDNVYAALGAVPEPATWTMLIMGFGSIGFMLRRQREKDVLATA